VYCLCLIIIVFWVRFQYCKIVYKIYLFRVGRPQDYSLMLYLSRKQVAYLKQYGVKKDKKVRFIHQVEDFIKSKVMAQAQKEFQIYYNKNKENPAKRKIYKKLKRMPKDELFEVFSIRFSYRNANLINQLKKQGARVAQSKEPGPATSIPDKFKSDGSLSDFFSMSSVTLTFTNPHGAMFAKAAFVKEVAFLGELRQYQRGLACPNV